jgi:hypothetical protein
LQGEPASARIILAIVNITCAEDATHTISFRQLRMCQLLNLLAKQTELPAGTMHRQACLRFRGITATRPSLAQPEPTRLHGARHKTGTSVRGVSDRPLASAWDMSKVTSWQEGNMNVGA